MGGESALRDYEKGWDETDLELNSVQSSVFSSSKGNK